MHKRTCVIAAGLLASGLAVADGKQPTMARTTLDGVYTHAQAERGRAVYQENCAACHGSDLVGVESMPGFVGSDFINRWGGRPLSDLHSYSMRRMPPGREGAIGDQRTADVIAYLLARNSMPAGTDMLRAANGDLHNIILVAADTAAQLPGTPPVSAAVAPEPKPQQRRDAADSGTTTTIREIKEFVPLTDTALRNPDPNDWVMIRGNYEGYGHSPLTQINRENVGKLQLVWSRAMEPGINQATPIVYKGVMYLGNPGDVIQAIDAATGTLLWQYRRKLPSLETLKNVWGQRKRSVALYDDKVYFVSWDNFVVALDARTGKGVWETDRGGNYDVTNTSGPIVVNGVVIAGSNCQRAAFGCYVTGHDAATGQELWRNEFIPKPGEPGDETWGKTPYEKRWMTGAWGPITYDPELNLVFYGSTAVGPAAEGQRDGIGATMAGTNTRYAVDPKTGRIAWKHQVMPRDNWDLECTFEMMPITLDVRPDRQAEGMLAIGRGAKGTRRTLTGMPCKNGLVWSFDAKTGEFLWTKQTTAQNLIASIDRNGLVTVREDQTMQDITQEWLHCPSHFGGRNWPFSAYNPRLKVLYVMLQNTCAEKTVRQREPIPLYQYNVQGLYVFPEGKSDVGRIDAISLETGRTLWSWETRVSNYSPVLSTESNLLFNGDMDRYVRAFDQETGQVLWQTRLASQAMGATVSFGVEGRQYIAIAAGGGYNAGGLGMTPEADALSGNNTVYVFALPEGAD